MKLFDFAIASVVDSNTGFGLSHSNHIDYGSVERFARPARPNALTRFLIRLRSGLATLGYQLRKRAELRRSVNALDSLDDRLLEDIGFSRGDVLAAKYGYLDKTELERQRVQNRGSQRLRLYQPVSSRETAGKRQALNDATFARARCA